MAKTLRTSGDYTVKAGAGASGSHYINLDAKYTRIKGDLIVDGDQTTLNTQTITLEDQFIELAKNNSLGDQDSGIFFNRGSEDSGLFYWDAAENSFKIGTTSNTASINEVTNITLKNLKIADPTDSDHAATKNYVDTQIISGGFSINFEGDDSTAISINTGSTIYISGGNNITTSATEEPDQINVNLNRDLNGIDSVSTDRSNQNLTLTANGTGAIVINNILTFDSTASDPAGTPTTTKIYHKAVGGGDTGIYFKNPNDTVGELISKSKATALAIALG